jgi:hypothetical protein
MPYSPDASLVPASAPHAPAYWTGCGATPTQQCGMSRVSPAQVQTRLEEGHVRPEPACCMFVQMPYAAHPDAIEKTQFKSPWQSKSVPQPDPACAPEE